MREPLWSHTYEPARHSAILLVRIVWDLVFVSLVLGLKFSGFDLIDITPDPRFARFDRAYQRVLYFLEVLGSVFVLRRVATPYVAAREAQAQVNPSVTHLHAFFADMLAGCLDFNLIEVCASVMHGGVSQKALCSGQVTSVILRKANLREKGAILPHNEFAEVFHTCFVLITFLVY